MALDRVGPTTAPLGTPDRPQPLRPGVTPDPAELVDYPLAPLAPVGLLVDGFEGLPLGQGGWEAQAAAQAAETPNANDPAAMRPNQVFLSRQLVWAPPDTGNMAASWLVMVRTYGEQRAALLEQASGRHVPASLFMADHTPAVPGDGRERPPLVTQLEPWRFAVYAWGAEQLLLKVVCKEDDPGEAGPEPRRRRPRIALRLELVLPGVGRVVIQMEPVGDGVVLEVGARQPEAMQHMRELLPQLATTVSRSGLHILRCRLRRDVAQPDFNQPHPSRMQVATLTPAIFKAMAEVAVLLSQPLPPDDIFSETA